MQLYLILYFTIRCHLNYLTIRFFWTARTFSFDQLVAIDSSLFVFFVFFILIFREFDYFRVSFALNVSISKSVHFHRDRLVSFQLFLGSKVVLLSKFLGTGKSAFVFAKLEALWQLRALRGSRLSNYVVVVDVS